MYEVYIHIFLEGGVMMCSIVGEGGAGGIVWTYWVMYPMNERLPYNMILLTQLKTRVKNHRC